jgi:hypothetical protein
MPGPDMRPGGWARSSYSGGSGGNNCVEVRKDGDLFLVRDSKAPHVAPLMFTEAEWFAFLSGVADGEFDL